MSSKFSQPGDDDVAAAQANETAADDKSRNAFDRGVVWCARGAAWLVFIAMVISVFEVLMRYGFNSPTSWVHESVVMLVAVSFAIGGPAAMAGNHHIRVRVLYDNAGPRLKLWLDRFNDLVTLGFCLGMSYAAFMMFWDASHNPLGEWSLERSGTSWNPPFPALVKGIIMASLVLMSVQALIHSVQSLRAKQAPPTSPTSTEGSV
ncbi:TRAP-type mannitol/chloroaromatic compound transport system, small permease component [Onishia taeanensis]|uniref:TRAP transporter small permease protein n=1 Tax=Onishia taeanensis TaxID=284577 RepID=A0A1G7VIS7_9GAMM|nr:TRAP transporter small permease subunit [Halomonas taeanensis]SDG59597.1 TRAP-type mannitol/chloroaromatic compound transport system, small permease component [Halomonas taeanensis]